MNNGYNMTRALILTKSYEQTTKIVKVNESCTIRLISKNNNAKQTFKKRKKPSFRELLTANRTSIKGSFLTQMLASYCY